MTIQHFYDRVKESTTTTGTGTLTLSGAVTGYQTFAVVGNSKTCFYVIEAVDNDGRPTGDWEVGRGTYTAAGTTLSRQFILASSNSNNAVNLSAGTKHVFLTFPAQLCSHPAYLLNGRLTTASSCPVHYPSKILTPSSTDTGADTVTFGENHGWTTGTMVIPNATGGGLTAGTTYWITRQSATEVSFATTLANALSATAVNLTASITAALRPFGSQQQTLFFCPYLGAQVAVFEEDHWMSRWLDSEKSLSLTVTSGNIYDVFVYWDGSTLALELSAAWASDTARTDDLTLQDGVYLKNADKTRRLVGCIRAVASNTVEDSELNRLCINSTPSVMVPRQVYRFDDTNSWNYASASYTSWNSSSTNRVTWIDPGLYEGSTLVHNTIDLLFLASASHSAGSAPAVGIGIDSTSVNHARSRFIGTSTNSAAIGAKYNQSPGIGYHYAQMLMYGVASGTTTFFGDAGVDFLESSMTGHVWG